ncbi:MAG: 50S ribosomal protein L25/general stress protein Ctc [Rhodobiaceae bacterium]|nr:50S ribosomal protein L25/general stress protein Ctc [Rhodobiaceae bacterium]
MSATAESMQASARDRVGKGAARALRREGLIPAVIYGEKQPAEPIAVSYKEINRRIHSGHFLTQVLDIEVNGKKTRVLPRDFQLDPVRDYPLHVDFLRLGANTKIAVFVPVHFINEEECPGIRRGGVLNIVRHEIELECAADEIPEQIVCDLTGLDVGDSLHISAITLPKGATPTITDRDFTVATIAAPAGLRSEESGASDEADEAEDEASEEE